MDRFAELKAFTAVAAGGGFSAAARQLGVAPSSVTRLVDALEERLATPLLNRSTRSVTLTDAGRTYYASALAILAQMDEADEAAGAGEDGVQGLLRVSAPVTFCTLFIAPLLAELTAACPRLDIELHLTDAVSNMVDDAIDVAIRIGASGDQPNLVARRLGGHRRVICASPAYVRTHGAPQLPADLLRYNCLRFAYGAAARRPAWRFQKDGTIEDIPVRGTITANHSDVLRRAVLDGAGIALLPDWLVCRDLAAGTLVPLLPGYETNPGAMDIGLYAMYQANRRGSGKVRAFVDFLAARLHDDALCQGG